MHYNLRETNNATLSFLTSTHLRERGCPEGNQEDEGGEEDQGCLHATRSKITEEIFISLI